MSEARFVLVLLVFACLGCGEDSGSNEDSDEGCGQNSYVTGNSCTCLDGFDWCTNDPSDFDCCRQAPTCGDRICDAGETNQSCPSDCQASTATCGDRICDAGETNQSCPSDCPCSIDSCASDEVCIDGTCSNAFGRRYGLSLSGVQVSESNPDGSTWDALGGLPDPKAAISIDGAAVCQYETRSDTLVPAWSDLCLLTVNGGSQLVVELVDEDVAVDDVILICTVELPVSTLRHGFTCSGSAVELAGSFVPQ